MADISSFYQTYTNAGANGALATTNFEQIVNTQGISGRVLVCTLVKDAGDMTEAELVACLKSLGQAGGDRTGTDTGGPDAFTVVGISDFDGSDPAYIMLQGTGTPIAAPVVGFTLAVIATFAV